MRARPIGDRFRRNVGRWGRADVRRLLVHDVRNFGRPRRVGFPWMLEHIVLPCNPDTTSTSLRSGAGTTLVVRTADLTAGLYGLHS